MNVLHRYRIFAIVEQALRLPSGRTVVRQVVQHPGAVVIIPPLEDNCLVLIAQYRFAVGETLLEFPAGTLEPGEAPLECARRELIEETGYRAEHWRALGILYPSPGYCDEQQYLFMATGLVPEHVAGDEDEILEVKGLTVQEVERAIADGTLVDAKSIAAYARATLQEILGGMSVWTRGVTFSAFAGTLGVHGVVVETQHPSAVIEAFGWLTSGRVKPIRSPS
jgi:ADP-ribose pyrophosphatase